MIAWIGLSFLLASGQVAAAHERPEVAVVVVTLDEARQGQIKHGRSLLGVLGDERFGRYRWVDPETTTAAEFSSCEDRHPDYGLNFCIRFTRHSTVLDGTPPTAVVVFTDRNDRAPATGRADEMRVLCYGPGAGPANAEAQDTWLWPNSARMHGMRDWDRDKDALAACIDAAISEEPGVPRPD